MPYSHDPSTPAYYAEVLAAALSGTGNWEPSPTVIGDVALSETRTIGVVVDPAETQTVGRTIATQTVTLYPEFYNGRAKGSVSSSITWLPVDGKELQTKTGTCWFWFDENCNATDLANAIAHAFQALK